MTKIQKNCQHRCRNVRTIVAGYYYYFRVCDLCGVTEYPCMENFEVKSYRDLEIECKIRRRIMDGWAVYKDTHAMHRKVSLVNPDGLEEIPEWTTDET